MELRTNTEETLTSTQPDVGALHGVQRDGERALTRTAKSLRGVKT